MGGFSDCQINIANMRVFKENKEWRNVEEKSLSREKYVIL